MFAERTLESVFSRLIEPPAMESLNAAKQRLQDLGALTEEERLTPLGYHLACLPVDVRIGKLMLFGAIFRCLDAALTIAASLAFKSPFVREAVRGVDTRGLQRWLVKKNIDKRVSLPVCVLQVSPWDKREEANEKKQAFALASSDHLALLQAYKVRFGLDSVQCDFTLFSDRGGSAAPENSLFIVIYGICLWSLLGMQW